MPFTEEEKNQGTTVLFQCCYGGGEGVVLTVFMLWVYTLEIPINRQKRRDIGSAWSWGSDLVWRFKCGQHQPLEIWDQLGQHHPTEFPVMMDIVTSVVSSVVATSHTWATGRLQCDWYKEETEFLIHLNVNSHMWLVTTTLTV